MQLIKVYACCATVFLGTASVAYSGGFVYVQTNEPENKVIVYQKNDDGTLEELSRVPTTGQGTGEIRTIQGTPGPDPLTSNGSLIFAKDASLLFASNAGDNSVSVFSIGEDGMPMLIDREASEGDAVNSLSYRAPSQTLYVGHSRGPDHIKLMDFTGDDLVLRDQAHTLDTEAAKGRIQTQVVLSPNGDYLLGNVLFDQVTDAGPVPSAQDQIAVFPVSEDGTLSEPKFHTLEGKAPFASAFVNSDANNFVTLFAVSNNLTLSKVVDGGEVMQISNAHGDDAMVEGKPLEYCWISLSPDHNYAYLTSFGAGQVASFQIDAESVSLAQSGLAEMASDSEFKALAGIPTSAPVDSWSSEDGYFYQLYGATGKLGAFRMTEDGGLEEIAFYDVPVNSVQGITGY